MSLKNFTKEELILSLGRNWNSEFLKIARKYNPLVFYDHDTKEMTVVTDYKYIKEIMAEIDRRRKKRKGKANVQKYH